MKEQIDLPSSSEIGLESVSLRRIAFQPDALPALHGIADFHAAIAKNLGINDALADFKLRVAITHLNLQIAVKAAGTTVAIGCNLQNHLDVESDIIRLFELDVSVNLVHGFSLPTP
jgi:hypothetical protein